MKRSAKLVICPDCNTTLSFTNSGLTKEELLTALEFIKQQIVDDSVDIQIYNNRLDKNIK